MLSKIKYTIASFQFSKIHILLSIKVKLQVLLFKLWKAPSTESRWYFQRSAVGAYRPRIWISSDNSHIGKQGHNVWESLANKQCWVYFSLSSLWVFQEQKAPFLFERAPWLWLWLRKVQCFHFLGQDRLYSQENTNNECRWRKTKRGTLSVWCCLWVSHHRHKWSCSYSQGPFARNSFIYFGVGQTSSMSASSYGNGSN